MQFYRVELTAPSDPLAQNLIDELSQCLAQITGDSGRKNASPDSLAGPGCVFALAYNSAGEAVACGGIRPLANEGAGIAEIKRMYAQPGSAGAGSAILAFLEQQAQRLAYSELWLETRKLNHRALRFYDKHRYSQIPNYGNYRGNPLAVCLAKKLAA